MSTPTTVHGLVPVADRALNVPKGEGVERAGRTPPTRQYEDRPVDVKVALAALWTAMLFVFAYVDIFAFLRADVLQAALDGKVVNPAFTVNQAFLTATLIYILVPVAMVVLSLVLKPRTNRITNITVSLVYLISVAASCLGETWAYYLIGSAIEALLLVAIARIAWKWPSESPSTRAVGVQPAEAASGR